MTDDERKLLLLTAKFMVSPIGTANTRLDDIADLVNKIDTKAAPKPPKFPIGSRVATIKDFLARCWPGYNIFSGSIGTVKRQSANDLYAVLFEYGLEIWVHADNLTAVEIEADINYRRRLLGEWAVLNPNKGPVYYLVINDLNFSTGDRLDAYGADLGIIRRGTEGAKK